MPIKLLRARQILLIVITSILLFGAFRSVLSEERGDELTVLIQNLKNKSPTERAKACQKIGRLCESAETAVDSLIPLLTDKEEIDSDAKNHVVDGYTLGSVNYGPGKISISCFAAEALAAIGQKAKKALPSLVSMLQDESYKTRINAMNAIKVICSENDRELKGAIVSALKDSGALVRRDAATALGKILRGTHDVPKELVQLLEDSDEYVKRRAQGAIQMIQENGHDILQRKDSEEHAQIEKPDAKTLSRNSEVEIKDAP